MFTNRIPKEERELFYQSKYEYFRVVSGYSVVLIALLEMTYFISDCLLFGRFATETLIPRFAIIFPLALFLYFYRTGIRSYKIGAFFYYMIPHASMWCTIWTITYLENRDFAREGFIIMHFAFLATGLAMPLIYHIPIHFLLLLNILISNTWIHYEKFAVMISVAMPLYVGVTAMLFIWEKSYMDQYLIRKEIETASITDQLTKTYNRNKLISLVNNHEQFLFKNQTTLFLLDIDDFKQVNDKYAVAHTDNGVCPLTISVGVYEYQNDNYHTAIENADMALYYAKRHGKNQVVNYAKAISNA